MEKDDAKYDTEDDTKENRIKKLVNLLKENKDITIKNLSKKLLVSEITIKRDIDYLQKNNILKRFGGRKECYRQFIEN